ncbi:WSC-domain-containing protein [Aspergillus ellipticus CBS 707.79]|uniref:WSC-domain-containing protein n=1 Tax=Aspergillus ellipticus CBS 707.79 TaxID=1448320 RepID=A0A319CU74_9EURO|nr:WSC-domain-containing protein [Aspergillus ellipticus CBS 707.79]
MCVPFYFGALLAAALSADATFHESGYLGCYSSAGGLTNQGPYTYQSVAACSELCEKNDASFAGVSKGTDCWCGSSPPSATDQVSSTLCNIQCAGWPEDKCGGTNVLDVYQLQPGYDGSDGDDGDGSDGSDDGGDGGSGGYGGYGDNDSTTTTASSFTVFATSLPATTVPTTAAATEPLTTADSGASTASSASGAASTTGPAGTSSALASASSASAIPSTASSGASRRLRFLFF